MRYLIPRLMGVLLTAMPLSAMAYVGPGLGLGAVVVVICIFVSIVLAVAGLVWYPLKRRFKRAKPAIADDDPGDQPETPV